MKEMWVSANKDKIIVGAVTAVALFCVGVGLASVLSDSKNVENNWNNVVDLGDGGKDDYSYGVAWDDTDSAGWGTEDDGGMSGGLSEEDSQGGLGDSGMAVNNPNAGVTISTSESVTKGETQDAGNVSAAAEQEVGAGVASDPLSAYTFTQTSALMWPVFGDIVMGYSIDSTVLHKTLGVYKTNPAISIAAAQGDDVNVAADGIVQSVYDSDETGTTVVVAVGDGYVTTYGLVDNVEVSAGERVVAGQKLGTVGAPTAYYLSEGTNVYFAVTKDGNPVDPLDFLVDR